jgi:uncharacterized membrane protein
MSSAVERIALPNALIRIFAERPRNVAIWRDERGVSAVVVAIALTVVIGFGALGAETGMWYAIKRQNQSAADAAAISAAYEVLAGNTSVSTYLTPAATRAASQNGYNGAAPVVTYPYGRHRELCSRRYS